MKQLQDNSSSRIKAIQTEHHTYLNIKNSGAKLRCGFTNAKVHEPREMVVIQDEFALVYFFEANGEYSDHLGRKYQLQPGSVMLRLPGKKHVVSFRPGSLIDAFIAVPGHYYDMLAEMNAVPDHMEQVFNIGIHHTLIDRFANMLQRLKYCDQSTYFEWVMDGQRLIYDILMMNQRPGELSRQFQVQETCRMLRADLSQHLSYPDIAKSLHVSYSSLRKSFKKLMGISMEDYRIQQKIEKGKWLIIQNQLNLKEIAARLGYCDIHAFSNQFKKQTGFSPGKFRDHHLLLELGMKID